MKDNFPAALAHVLRFEGGYSDHPKDPGGATNLGITKAVLARFRGRPVSKTEVRWLTKTEASAIYGRYYWVPTCCDDLPPGLDLAVFDCAVNQGAKRAAFLLQQAANVPADGKVGPITTVTAARADPVNLLGEFMARRMDSYGSLQSLFETFGLGWSRRLIATHAAALAMLQKQIGVQLPVPAST